MSQPPQPPFSGDPQPGELNPGQPYYSPPPAYPAQPEPPAHQQFPGEPSQYATPDYPVQPSQYSAQPDYPAQPSPYPAQPDYPAQPQYSGTPYPAAYQPPFAGQPNPDVPSSVPPGYPPQPGFGPPPPPVEPPRQKGRTLPIVLTSVAIFLVLCLGGSTAAVLVFRNQGDDKLTAADSTPESTGPATTESTEEPSPDPTTAPPARSAVKIVHPKTLGGRPQTTDDLLKSYLDLLKTTMSNYPGATKPVSGVYGEIGSDDMVVMAAAQADVQFPEITVDAVLAGGNSKTKLTGITKVSTGAFGGAAKCGTASESGQKMAICVWADGGSLGMVIFYFKSASAIKNEFPKMRAEIEKKA